jgi:hypothetical protein
MPLPRMRFTVRRMMVVVAVLAILVWLGERHLRFTRLSEYHRSNAGIYLEFDEQTGWVGYVTRDGRDIPERVHLWHAKLEDKFRESARHPWLPIQPDPPDPK